MKNLTKMLIISIPVLSVAVVTYVYHSNNLVSSINQELLQAPSSAGPLPVTGNKTWKVGQILVKRKAGLPDVELEKTLKIHNAKAIEKIGSLDVHIVSVPAQAEEAVVKALSANPNIEFAELDIAAPLTSMTPNDLRFGSAWHLPKIQAPSAWDFAKADSVIIAILDSGVDGSHPDLVNQMIPGWNAVDGSSATNDINGHGTAVAGTAEAASNNAIGVASVAWNAKILPVRITNDPTGNAYWSDVARGLDWATNQGAKVANISYEVTGSSAVNVSAQNFRAKGGMVVVGAGNSSVDPGLSNNPNMITVSATTSADVKASWSNYGAMIDIAAPGTPILTTNRGGGYGNWQGTSFSSPIVAGVVALIVSANPSLTADQIESVLKSSADKIDLANPSFYGSGRVNASAAVQLAQNTVPADTTVPIVGITSPASGTIVSGIVAVTVSASDNVGVNTVSLYANGVLVGTDGVAPYEFSWDSSSIADGSAKLTASAADIAGNTGKSSDLAVTVKNQPTIVDTISPTVTISNPTNGSIVSGNVSININTSDNIGVTKIVLKIDGKLISSTNSSALNYIWNTKKIVAGSHTIVAVASDAVSNSAQQTIQVTK